MPRPPRCRRICDVPQVDKFCPNGGEDVEPILLTLDEYEVRGSASGTDRLDRCADEDARARDEQQILAAVHDLDADDAAGLLRDHVVFDAEAAAVRDAVFLDRRFLAVALFGDGQDFLALLGAGGKGSAGEREDKSGPMIVEMLKDVGYDIKETILLPDEQKKLEKELIRLADQRQLNVIFTTGGTGFSERDRTPEATVNVCDRMANGIAEAIRNYSMTITKRAMFSRAVSGIRKKTLIINLPGSPKAVQEALEFLLPELGHGLGILRGTEGECARK